MSNDFSELPQKFLDRSAKRLLNQDSDRVPVDYSLAGAAMGEALQRLKKQVPTHGKLSDSPEVTGQGPEKPKDQQPEVG